MTQDQTKALSDDAFVDALFAEARHDDSAVLPQALEARLLHDAGAMLPRPPVSAPVRDGFWTRFQRFLSEFGGAPGLASFGAAGVAGLWIGWAGPGAAGDLLTQFWDGAATISPSVASWGSASESGSDDFIALLSGDLN